MVELVAFTENDFPRLLGWIQSPELLVQWAGPGQFTYPLTRRQLKAYLRLSRGKRPRSMIYKVVHGAAEVAGHIELGAINRQNGTASVCRVFLDPNWRGRGICAEMVRGVLATGFGELGLRRIDLRVFGFNKAAIRCYERAGLVREGLLRKAVRVGDQCWDTVLMGILREEWREAQPR
jgi:RimJ/RimL family protein N-acetyltransferase